MNANLSITISERPYRGVSSAIMTCSRWQDVHVPMSPRTKTQSRHYRLKGSLRSKKAARSTSEAKFLFTVFLNYRGVVRCKPTLSDSTITEECHIKIFRIWRRDAFWYWFFTTLLFVPCSSQQMLRLHYLRPCFIVVDLARCNFSPLFQSSGSIRKRIGTIEKVTKQRYNKYSALTLAAA